MVTEEHLGLACAPACLSAGSWCRERAVCSSTESRTRHLVLLAQLESVCVMKDGKSQINAFGHGLRCESSSNACAGIPSTTSMHACRSQHGDSVSTAHECCSFQMHRSSNLSLPCFLGIKSRVHWHWLGWWWHNPSEEEMLLWGNPLCIPDPRGLQGDEINHFSSLFPPGCCLWVFLVCREVRTFPSSFSFLLAAVLTVGLSRFCPAVCHVGGCCHLRVQLGGWGQLPDCLPLLQPNGQLPQHQWHPHGAGGHPG